MGSLPFASLIAVGAVVGALAVDVTVNVLQDWYQVVYADAFWANRVTDAPALRDLAREEERINEMLRASSDFSERKVVLPPVASR